MLSPLDVAVIRRRSSILSRAVARWDARAYDGKLDALLDLSGNGLHARLGSAVGADTNDPLRLQKAGAKYIYFPGSANNSLSLPRPVASVDYLITYSDGTTDTGNSTADPLVFGTTDVKFAGLKVRSIALTNNSGGAAVGSIDANLLSEPYASYTDPQGNVWTLNRSATGRKLAVVDRDLLLLGTDDYLEVADSPLLNFGAGDKFSAVVLVRRYGSLASEVFLAKRDGAAGSDVGYNIRSSGASPANTLFLVSDGTSESNASATGIPASGIATLFCGIRGNGMRAGSPDSLTSGSDVTTGTLSNSDVLRIGRYSGAGTAYGDFEFIAAAIFRFALTADELIRLKGEMLAL